MNDRILDSAGSVCKREFPELETESDIADREKTVLRFLVEDRALCVKAVDKTDGRKQVSDAETGASRQYRKEKK